MCRHNPAEIIGGRAVQHYVRVNGNEMCSSNGTFPCRGVKYLGEDLSQVDTVIYPHFDLRGPQKRGVGGSVPHRLVVSELGVKVLEFRQSDHHLAVALVTIWEVRSSGGER